MKILLIGECGRMGHEVVIAAREKHDEIIAGIDHRESHEFDFPVYNDISKVDQNADVIIDFSTCQDRTSFFEFAEKNKIPYCCFSTNLSCVDEMGIRELSKKVKVLKCANASLGINAMFDLVEKSCELLPSADVVIEEYHHKEKKDTPSGTAKKIEDILQENQMNFTTAAFRVGNERGTHLVKLFLEDEVLEIKHTANSRKIFAYGAIEKAKRLLN